MIRDKEGRIVSMGLDTTSSQYPVIKHAFTGLIIPWEEDDTPSEEGLIL